MKYVFSIPKIMIRKISNKKDTLKAKTQGQEESHKGRKNTK